MKKAENELLHVFAEDSNGTIINIKSAISGVDYFCPECKNRFLLKKGNVRRHHFAHSNYGSCCSTEGYLHKTFKKLLFQYIKECINENIQIEINWQCNICKNEHKGNLLLGINDVKVENPLEGCRPDISLIRENSVPIIIEIVDTHEPERNVIDYCIKYNVILIIIKLESIMDLEKTECKIRNPTKLVYFSNMNCFVYYNYIMNMKSQEHLKAQLYIPNYKYNSRPTIDQISADNARKKYFAIKNYYKKRKK